MTATATLPKPITDYQSLSADELFRRTVSAKRLLGDRVMILGHNYQRDEVIQHADFRGDSLLLAKLAAERSERPYIVFCGVHFMAETADILSRSQQTVILPDMAAGCSMADMAAIEQVDQCWEAIGRVVPADETVMPAVYAEFSGSPQVVLWGTWRNHLYVIQCQSKSLNGRGQDGRRSSSSPMSIWAGIRQTKWGFLVSR